MLRAEQLRGLFRVALAAVVASAAAMFAQQPPGFANPDSCAGCHPAIAQKYALTGMARTFGDMHSASAQLPAAVTFAHAPSAETISVTRAAELWRMERKQTGMDGSPSNVRVATIDYWFGSGNHARSYFSRTARNELIELPLTWYSEKNGYWAMSPGYDSPSHAGFSRKVTYRCMFCHSAYPAMPANADRMDTGSLFPAALPQGIDCQRCHGPGLRHVNAALAGRPPEELKSAIVNPAGLTAERRDEVCFQCHLETTTSSLPDYLPVYGRGVFSYVPGEPIEKYARFFDYAGGTGHDDRFEFTGAPYRLRQSKCFTASQGTLQCITCHDPHEPDKAKSIARANAACADCHRGPLSSSHVASRECVSCHMPERTPTDSIHVTVTDHLIRRNPERTPSPTTELNSANTPPYRGEVVPYYPQVDDLYTAVAQVRSRANMESGIPRLEKAIVEAGDSVRPEFYAELADAFRHSDRSAEAIPYYRKAISLDGAYWPAQFGLGLALAASGNPAASLPPLREAAALSGGDASVIRSLAATLTTMGRQPEAMALLRNSLSSEPDSAELHNDLGTALLRSGDNAGAENAMREAVRLRPESASIRTNFANLLARTGKMDEARFEFRAAIRTDPSLAEAHTGFALALASQRRYAEARDQFLAALKINPAVPNTHNNFGAVLRELGDHAGAVAQYREAIRYDGTFTTARYNLALELTEQNNPAEAEQQLNEAIRTNPRYYAAHLQLAEILIAAKKNSEAAGHLRIAAMSPDPALSGQASAMLIRIAPGGRSQ